MTTNDNALTGLSDLITHYKAEPEKTGNLLAKRICDLLTHSSVRNKIAKAAGGYAGKISISLDDLVDEVRQEAVMASMARVLEPDFEVLSDQQSAQYIFNAVQFAAGELVNKHLGSKTDDGRGRTKGLSTSPLKLDTDTESEEGCAASRAINDKLLEADPDLALIPSDMSEYLAKIQNSDPKVHRCLSLLLEGKSQVEVAQEMSISDRTVRNYIEKARQSAQSL